MTAKYDANDKCRDNKKRNLHEVLEIEVPIKSADCFTHGCDAVGKRKPRVNGLEKAGHHFNGIKACRTRNLQDNEEYTEGLADMLECNGKRINKSDVDNGFNDAGKDKSSRTYALNLQKQISDTADGCLKDCKKHHQKPSAEIALPGSKASDVFMVHFKLIDGDKNNATNPKGEIGVKRRDT